MLTDAARDELRAHIRILAAQPEPTGLLTSIRELLRGTAKPGPDTTFAASMLNKVGQALSVSGELRRLRTFLVRSVTLEPALPALHVEAALAGFQLDLELGGYGAYVDDLMNAAGELDRFRPELVLIVLDLEDVAAALPDLCAAGRAAEVEREVGAAAARIAEMLRSLRTRSAARLVLQGFVVPDRTSLGDVAEGNLAGSLPEAIAALNLQLAALCRSLADCVFFDADRVAARVGRARWQDPRLFLSSRLPLAPEAFTPYARGLVRAAATLFRPARKVLCTDLDNTLWGGVLGEEGPAGIATGSAFPGNCFREYQRYLLQLRSRGVLLAAVSKNNEPDVAEAFALRAADLALTLDDFAARKISWNDKVDALRELSEELSLALDAFVFVDDNPAECEAVRQALPEVAVVQAPADEPWRLVELLSAESFFDTVILTDDDRRRAGEYRAQAERASLAAGFAGGTGSREDFLASLDIVCTFLPATEAPLARSVQLLGKTNQFNLTTRRHGAAQLERFSSANGGQAIAVRVRDRFGDAGVVGLALVRTEGTTCRIDSLLLSCRVIGRGIETALLSIVAAQAQRDGARRLIGEYIPTRKNSPCAGFYPDHGFAPAQDPSVTPAGAGDADTAASLFYELHLNDAGGHPAAVASPAWLTLEGTQPHELAAGTPVAS